MKIRFGFVSNSSSSSFIVSVPSILSQEKRESMWNKISDEFEDDSMNKRAISEIKKGNAIGYVQFSYDDDAEIAINDMFDLIGGGKILKVLND